MASHSPRSRVDQFFTSKKRKAKSPCSKPGRNEKGGKTVVEGSPSGKGTLDNYLVASQDEPLCAGRDSLARQDPVKRSLSVEIDGCINDECKRSSQSQVAKTLDASQKGMLEGLPRGASVAVGGSGKGTPDLVQGAENTELQKFAADFLSLYCSEIQSNVHLPSELKVNDHKRQASPLPQETSNKKHCVTDQSNIECKNTCYDINSEYMQSTIVRKAEVTIDKDLFALQPTLMKCSNTSKSSLDIIECSTPGSLIAKSSLRETPKSGHGSSIFSPGEAFWHEAIQLADGLCGPMVNLSAKAAENNGAAESQCHKKNSCNLRIANCDGKLMETINEGKSMSTHASLGRLLGRHGDSKEEKSPIPVKHFDFSSEDKNLGGSIVHYDVTGDLKSTTHGGGVPFGPIVTSPRNDDNINHCRKSEKNKAICGEEETLSVTAVTKRKGNLVGRDKESINYEFPIGGITTTIGNCESGEATPSNVMPSKDWLDLNNWLPSEICNIYRKKGISKLYPWQVDCLQVDGVLQRRNLVYCASTSAGKSFVAEILMLRRVLSFGKMALLVLPYVSICAEKAEHLEVLLEPLGKHVRSYYGTQGGGALPKDTSVAVCTIEKANSLINRLLEEGRLLEVGIIVIDELHMVGDRSRGYLLELMLTKLRYASGEGNSEGSSGESFGMSSGKADCAHGLQIVGMSATMPNVGAVADWLQVRGTINTYYAP